jgi:hypothetical protein
MHAIYISELIITHITIPTDRDFGSKVTIVHTENFEQLLPPITDYFTSWEQRIKTSLLFRLAPLLSDSFSSCFTFSHCILAKWWDQPAWCLHDPEPFKQLYRTFEPRSKVLTNVCHSFGLFLCSGTFVAVDRPPVQTVPTNASNVIREYWIIQ